MAGKVARCTNFGNCSIADKKQDMAIQEGVETLCPECGLRLVEKKPEKKSGMLIGVLLALGLVVSIGAVAYNLLKSPPVQQENKPIPPPPPPHVQQEVPPPVPFPEKTAQVATPPPALPAKYEAMVHIGNFWIDKHEVSIAEFKEYSPRYKTPKGFTDDMPVVDVTWTEAKGFAEKHGKRLCAPGEWLSAAGDTSNLSKANLNGNAAGTPLSAQDDREKNHQGLLNMLGNVSEWVDASRDDASFVGGYWYWKSDMKPEGDITTIKLLGTKENYHHYIGFRCCSD